MIGFSGAKNGLEVPTLRPLVDAFGGAALKSNSVPSWGGGEGEGGHMASSVTLEPRAFQAWETGSCEEP